MDDQIHDIDRNQQSNPEADTATSQAAPDFSVQPSYVRTVFLSSDGLRAGWGFAFYVATFYPLQFVATRWANSLHIKNWLWSMLLGEFGLLVAAILPSLALGVVEKRKWGTFGLPPRFAFGKLFWLGALWGFAGISLLLLSMYGLRAFDFGQLAMHGARIAKFAAFWAVMFLLVGFFEEFLLRGYSQFALTRAIGFWPSAILLSFTFGLIHMSNPGEQWSGLLAAALIGLFFCLTLRRTGSLWFAVGFHAAWDWGETFFYSVPDSGTVFPGQPAPIVISRPCLAHGRKGWPRGQRALLCGNRRGLGRFHACLSREEKRK